MKVFQWLILSLGFHIIIYFSMDYLPKRPARTVTPIEVTYVNPDENQPSNRVPVYTDQDQIKERIDKLKKLTRRLGKKAQDVKRESVASNSGVTKNRSNTPSRIQPKELVKDLKKQHMGKGLVTTPVKPKFTVGGYSTTFQNIPGVKKGSFTALNTDQFIYYTFYSRTNTQVGSRWQRNVVAHLQKLSMGYYKNLQGPKSTTYLEFLIDKDGKLVKTILRKSSGDPGLDLAAIEAFKEAAPLNNPPEELVNKDGLISLRYGFTVDWDPRLFARSSK